MWCTPYFYIYVLNNGQLIYVHTSTIWKKNAIMHKWKSSNIWWKHVVIDSTNPIRFASHGKKNWTYDEPRLTHICDQRNKSFIYEPLKHAFVDKKKSLTYRWT